MAQSLPLPTGNGKPKLLEQVRSALRLRHYSLHTEEAYWIRRFILFHGKRHPKDIGEARCGVGRARKDGARPFPAAASPCTAAARSSPVGQPPFVPVAAASRLAHGPAAILSRAPPLGGHGVTRPTASCSVQSGSLRRRRRRAVECQPIRGDA
jgi:hypothetical protein